MVSQKQQKHKSGQGAASATTDGGPASARAPTVPTIPITHYAISSRASVLSLADRAAVYAVAENLGLPVFAMPARRPGVVGIEASADIDQAAGVQWLVVDQLVVFMFHEPGEAAIA